jgi:membrane protease subunit HflC
VQEPQQVIVTQFGKPIGDPVDTPGLKFKVPIVQKVNRFDKRFIWVDTYARWRISDPLLFFQRLRDERGAQTRLDDILDGETRNAIANHDLVELIRSTNRTPATSEIDPADESKLVEVGYGRDVIREAVLSAAQTRTSDLGIEILDVQFKRINYVEDVRRKVYERMIAERRRIADRYRSEGEGSASRIRGERVRELKRIRSTAYREAREIRGRADAGATEIYAAAYNRSEDSREFYQFLKTMEIYRTTVDAETQLILSTDGEFYRFLK